MPADPAPPHPPIQAVKPPPPPRTHHQERIGTPERGPTAKHELHAVIEQEVHDE
jgi:hypothetical protein